MKASERDQLDLARLEAIKGEVLAFYSTHNMARVRLEFNCSIGVVKKFVELYGKEIKREHKSYGVKDNLMKKMERDILVLEGMKEEVFKFYETNSIRRTAVRFGMNVICVSEFLRRYNKKRGRDENVISCDVRNKIADHLRKMSWMNVESNTRVGRRFKVTPERVRQIRKELGLVSIKRLKAEALLEKEKLKIPEEVRKLSSLWTTGFKGHEIARLLEMKVSYVDGLIVKMRGRYPDLFPHRRRSRREICVPFSQ